MQKLVNEEWNKDFNNKDYQKYVKKYFYHQYTYVQINA